MASLLGGIEAGGTKFVCAVGHSSQEVLEEERFPTETPESTIQRCIDFFQRASEQYGSLKSIGIGTFGPVDLRRGSSTWGYITSTPKPHWSNTDLAGPIKQKFSVPVVFETDVNAAAYGEFRWGAAQGLKTFVYLTIGTGIGGGGMVEGNLMHGLVHPEMGHIRIPRDPGKDPFEGACPFHGDCLEGLAAGPAMEQRWGTPATKLPEDHFAWELQAEYLALASVNLICILSPQRIIFGGGVMHQKQLLPMMHEKVLKLLNDYVQAPEIIDHIDEYIVTPALGDQAGIRGALALAEDA